MFFRARNIAEKMSQENNLPDNIDKDGAESNDINVAEIKSSAKYLGNVTASSTGVINYSGATSAANNEAVVKASASGITATDKDSSSGKLFITINICFMHNIIFIPITLNNPL